MNTITINIENGVAVPRPLSCTVSQDSKVKFDCRSDFKITPASDLFSNNPDPSKDSSGSWIETATVGSRIGTYTYSIQLRGHTYLTSEDTPPTIIVQNPPGSDDT